jgi:uncharacterized membrane protein (DUF373 family)
MAERLRSQAPSKRQLVVRGLSLVEDIVYLGIGILLAISAFALLGEGFKTFLIEIVSHTLVAQFVELLDQILLMLLVIELLYTVQVSFREHGLVAEPFMVVALIAVIRRILVATAETAHLPEGNAVAFRQSIIELAMLTVMVLVLVASLIALQRQAKPSLVSSDENEDETK